MTDHRVLFKQSHRNLYWTYMGFALISVALGLNFIFLHPSFNAYVPPKAWEGMVFLALGLSKMAFLNVYRNLRLVRLVMAIAVALMLFHGGALTVAYFELHQTSLQLPITYFGIAMLGRALLVEPFMNPVTNGNGGKP